MPTVAESVANTALATFCSSSAGAAAAVQEGVQPLRLTSQRPVLNRTNQRSYCFKEYDPQHVSLGETAVPESMLAVWYTAQYSMRAVEYALNMACMTRRNMRSQAASAWELSVQQKC